MSKIMIRNINNLQRAFKSNLPGPTAQNLMAPRGSELYRIPSPQAVPAAVMILLYPDKKEWFFTLMKRRNVKEDKHAGQISLPGGRFEEMDLDYMACALRETQEEIGIDRNNVEIIGKLTELYVFASNHLVHPYVGFMDKKPNFSPDAREVESIFHVGLNHILRSDVKKHTDIDISGRTLYDVPYYDVNSEIVWGATAMILGEFLELWKVAHD